jgi:hypothetical protein
MLSQSNPNCSYQEIHEKRTIEILRELVEDEPVASAALVDVVVDLVHVGITLEISVHSQIQEKKSHSRRIDLNHAENNSKNSQKN